MFKFNFVGLNFFIDLLYNMVFNFVSLDEGETIIGARSTDDLVSDRRKYDFSDQIIWKEKTHAPFLTILNRRLAKYAVTDPEPKIMQDDYTQIIFTLNNDAGTGTTFELTNVEGALLQANDILTVLQTNAYATTKAEIVLVQSIGAEDSGPAGAGYRAITVSRAYEGGSAVDISTAANWRVIHNGLTYSEGDGIGESRNVEITIKQNYTEILKEAYEATGTFNATDYYGPVDMQYKARKARKDFFRRWEYKLWFGRKFKKTVAGKPKRFTGGLHEFIYDEQSTNFLDFSNSATNTTWNTQAQTIFTLGSESKWVFGGPGLMTIVDNAFTGAASVYTKNEQLSRKYLVQVMTLDTTHGTLNFVREQALADLPSYTNTGFVVDLPYIHYMYLKGRDVQILKNVQTNDKDTEKNALFAEIGMHRSFGESMYWIYNLD
jgi:hypothetical protein